MSQPAERQPIEPAPTRWTLPDPADIERWPESELVCVGADYLPGTVLAGYRAGIFCMPLPDADAIKAALPPEMNRIGWWSPNPRAVLPFDGFHASRSLRRSAQRFEIRVDTCFSETLDGCANPARPHGWINAQIKQVFLELFETGWSHSVEVFSIEDGSLAGGLIGTAIGGLFSADSKFHNQTDASKVAVWALVELLRGRNFTLLDVQWKTSHLAQFGVVEVSRSKYLEQLRHALLQTAEPLGPLEDPLRF